MRQGRRVSTVAVRVPNRVATEVRAAGAFLTRIPVASPQPAITGAAAFGLIGGLIGLAGAVPVLIIGRQAPLAAGALAVGAIALVSGGLHLDGLADTADALAAPTAEAATRARKDPRVGPAGTAAIAIAVLVDAALLGELADRVGPGVAALCCLSAAAGSRAIPPLVAVVLRRSRGRIGTDSGVGAGGWFAERTDATAALFASASALAIGATVGVTTGALPVLVGVIAGMAVAVAIAAWLGAVRGSIDGDGFGALVEVAFAAILLVTVLAL